MKKRVIILTNLIIILGVLLFVFLYANRDQKNILQAQINAFENMTVALEQVTANYLNAEQHLCDVWANYINASPMTMKEAVRFVRSVHIRPEVSGHIIYADDGSLSGLSTRSRSNQPGSNAVDYQKLDLFPDLEDLDASTDSLHITRPYISPVTSVQSIAFFDPVRLVDESGADRSALLLRVIPLSMVERQWVFPQESYENAEFALIDADGNYVIKGGSFQRENFYAYYAAFNEADPGSLAALKETIQGEHGSLEMRSAEGETRLVSHAPLGVSDGWAVLTSIPMADLRQDTTDWLLIGVVAAALIFLLLFDFATMLRLNKQLELSAQAAEAANQAKTDFLSTMSHDIRTPMNAIVGLTAIAEKNVTDTQSMRQHLRKIGMASNHLLTLINDILDISKVESGKLSLSPLTFSIVESAENLVNISQPMVKEKSIDFSFRANHIEHELLYADQLRLNQILINILSNAIKYTEPFGSVRVELREEPCDEPDRVKLIYVVADTGIGMTPEFMERMYQPFSRQTDSRVNTVQGTGLGLAITKQMVDLMDGDIQCQSQVGVGTTFTVTLNIPTADRQLEALSLDPIDVLIADDDPILLETARDTLSSLGVQAETAASGAQAVSMVASRHSSGSDYGVVILDWKMPDMDGVEAARRIRALVGDQVPILLISAYDWSDIEDAAREVGANGFISKPLFRSTLYEKLSELLGVENALLQEDGAADLRDVSILVAEDNDMNWEVIETLLDMYDIRTRRVENGKLAVEAMADPDRPYYDLIFMDIQMPVMNGLDATRAIRALEDPAAASIPIVAMTADAFSENILECMEAGMNGHIAKPVDIKLVLKEIRRIRTAAAGRFPL